ncbi:MAG: hypothetical protein H6566_07890 [Lewinellaceae bacterium]|nr:hypothetical protein [Lewinellaceae bacterium]
MRIQEVSLLTLLFLSLILTQCQPSGKPETATETPVPLAEALPGAWESILVRVAVNTAENTDSSYVFEIREEEWLERTGMRPIKAYFQPDNQYRQVFTAGNDTIISVARGMWNTFSDTLLMVEPKATYQYIVTIDKGLAEFRTLLDWDGDGQEDDEYLGVHRKISSVAE